MSGEQSVVERLQPRRWRTLAALQRVDSPATIDEVTDELHASHAPSDPLAGLESWDRTHQRLHEVDLPALELAGLIEYDGDRGVVTVPRTAEQDRTRLDRPAERVADASESGGLATVSGLAADEQPDDERSGGTGPWSTDGGRTVYADGATIDGGATSGRWPYGYLAAALASLVLVASTATLRPDDPTVATATAVGVVALFVLVSVHHVVDWP